MKKTNKLFAVVLSLMLVMSLSACGTKTESVEDVFKAMQENTKDMKSYDAAMKMDMTMKAQGQEMSMVMDTQMSFIGDPIKAKVISTVDMGTCPIATEIYMAAEEDAFNMYMNANGSWTKQSLEQAAFDQMVEQYGNSVALDPYLKNYENFKQIDDKEINGVKAAGYQGVLTGDSMQEVIDQSGILSQLGTTIDPTIFEGMKDIPLIVYVNKDTKMPVQIEMDMAEFMNGIMKTTMESLGQTEEVEVPTCNMILTYTSINNTDDFEIPAEALNS